MHCSRFAAALLLAVTLAALPAAGDEGFTPLFDGKSFDGWQQQGGKAKYTIENGEIVGTAVPNTPNSFLCTKKHYGDFELKLEFRVDPQLNSGVQIRSHVYDQPTTVETKAKDGKIKTRKIAAGRVHGYQVEIDPSDRAWSGGIYDEGRRGWLFSLQDKKKAQQAFRQNEWNEFRVEAKGDRIRTWINGVPAADLKDDMTPSGFIALQVHGVGRHPERAGKQVRWRNIMLKELGD
jgi:hypothetical protein